MYVLLKISQTLLCEYMKQFNAEFLLQKCQTKYKLPH